jgi:integrase
MPRQPEVHYRLKPADSNGNCLIYMDFAYHKQRLRYSFGQFVAPSNWNDKKEIVRNKLATTDDGKFKLNDLLETLKKVCVKTYNESVKNGIPAPAVLRLALDAFINRNHNDDPGRPTLYTLADRFVKGEIKNKGKDKSRASLNNYAAVLKHLKEFELHAKYKVDFDTVNLDFFYTYVTYLQKVRKLAINTVAKDISILKVFMGEAVDLGYTTNMQFKHKKFAFNEEETEHVYLTENELHSLYKFPLTNKKLEQVRDLFIFGAWVGLRFSDFSNIKPENIVQIDGDDCIKIITQKTKDLAIIPCNPVVLEIFNKYSCNTNRLPKALSNQKFNDYIKDVCKAAELTEKGRLQSTPDLMLWEAVSSHTARRSFATNYYLQGFPPIDLMKVTGHKTERSFLKYIRLSKEATAKRMAAHIKENWSKKLLRVA